MFKFFSKSKKNPDLKNNFLLADSLKKFFTHKKLSENFLEDLEDLLIASDIGAQASAQIIDNFAKTKFQKNIDLETVKKFLAKEIEEILLPCQAKLEINEKNLPQIFIFIGVNGAGKTTTIGKICANLQAQNKKILISACDTFRAGATAQLEIWAKRNNCEIMLPLKEGEEPASVAYRSLEYAKKNNFLCKNSGT
jgi:fused signal recognition particle receptor